MDTEGEMPAVEKTCTRCGMKGYHLENCICLDCTEAELRKNVDLVLPHLNGNSHIRGV